MCVCVCVCVCVCLPACLPVCLSVCLTLLISCGKFGSRSPSMVYVAVVTRISRITSVHHHHHHHRKKIMERINSYTKKKMVYLIFQFLPVMARCNVENKYIDFALGQTGGLSTLLWFLSTINSFTYTTRTHRFCLLLSLVRGWRNSVRYSLAD